MHINHTPAAPIGMPCIRDFAELLRDHLPEMHIKNMAMEELQRRTHEIVAEHPRFREEVPLVLSGETRRRQRLQGLLVVAPTGREQVA